MEAERMSCFIVPFHVVQTLQIHSEITLLHFFERSGIDSLSTLWKFWKIDYATKCEFSTFMPIRQGVIVIHAEDLQHDIHRFQTGFSVLYFVWLLCFWILVNLSAPKSDIHIKDVSQKLESILPLEVFYLPSVWF